MANKGWMPTGTLLWSVHYAKSIHPGYADSYDIYLLITGNTWECRGSRGTMAKAIERIKELSGKRKYSVVQEFDR